MLAARDVAVPAADRERILACTDRQQIGSWLRRAATAHSVADVLR